MKLLFISCCLLFMVSCGEFRKTGMNGKIIDKETGKPISDAAVNLCQGLDVTTTNTEGYFEVNGQTGAHKIDPVVEVTKDGYKPFQIKISYSENESSYSVKTETKWIRYKDTVFFNSKKTSFLLGVDIEKWSQDFAISDTLTIYLTKENYKKEVEQSINLLKLH